MKEPICVNIISIKYHNTSYSEVCVNHIEDRIRKAIFWRFLNALGKSNTLLTNYFYTDLLKILYLSQVWNTIVSLIEANTPHPNPHTTSYTSIWA